MHKLILNDTTEITIKEGASLENITTKVTDFQALGTIADKLTETGNLDTVKFLQDDIEFGI